MRIVLAKGETKNEGGEVRILKKDPNSDGGGYKKSRGVGAPTLVLLTFLCYSSISPSHPRHLGHWQKVAATTRYPA